MWEPSTCTLAIHCRFCPNYFRIFWGRGYAVTNVKHILKTCICKEVNSQVSSYYLKNVKEKLFQLIRSEIWVLNAIIVQVKPMGKLDLKRNSIETSSFVLRNVDDETAANERTLERCTCNIINTIQRIKRCWQYLLKSSRISSGIFELPAIFNKISGVI